MISKGIINININSKRLYQWENMNNQQACSVQQGIWRNQLTPYAEFRTTQNSKLAYKKHSHQQLSLGYIAKGETLTLYKDQQWQLRQGDLILIEPEQIHNCNPVEGQGRSYCMLYLDKQWCLQQLSRLYAQPINHFNCEQVVFSDESIITNMTLLMQSTENNLHQKWLIEKIAMDVLSAYCTINPQVTPLSSSVINIRKRLLDNIEKPDCLATIASKFSLSQETIIRTFKKQLGISPKAYLNNVRIEKSKLLLQQGDSIIDVALQLGFNDQSHFHKTFKNYSAMTPKQYQQVNFIQ
jgi:AraC-like DNA-binding protein